MPMRNAAATLGDTMASLAAQQIDGSWQLAAVDDGSTDGSAELAERLAATLPGNCIFTPLSTSADSRGTAAAGNLAMRHALGQYMVRCDADDTVPADAYSAMLRASVRNNADIVAGAMATLTHRARHITTRIHQAGNLLHGLNHMPIDTPHFSLCNKLISRRMMADNDIAFFDGIDRWEDLGVVARVLALEPRISIIDRPVYEYHCRPQRSSLSHDGKLLQLKDRLNCCDRLLEWFGTRSLTKRYSIFLDHLMFAAKVKYARQPNRDLRAWAAAYPEINDRIMRLRHVPLHYRLAFALAAMMYRGNA